jgi:hypothetical protein
MKTARQHMLTAAGAAAKHGATNRSHPMTETKYRPHQTTLERVMGH